MIKALLGTITGGLISLIVACAPEENLTTGEYLAKAKQCEQTFSNNIVNAYNTISNAWQDSKISVDEQKKALGYFNAAHDALIQYDKLGKHAIESPPSLSLDERARQYHALLDKNINGSDGGTPDLENYIKNDVGRKEVTVEAYFSSEEQEAVQDAINTALDLIL